MNTKTNVNTKKLASLLIALLMVFNVGAITVSAGNGPGTGGGEQNAPLSFQSVMYSTGTGYSSLQSASVSGTFSGYIRFDRGMTENSDNNFDEITLIDSNENAYELNLQVATAGVSESGTTYDKKYIYTFSVNNLPSGSYTLTLGEGITANNGQTLTNAPIVIYFSVS